MPVIFSRRTLGKCTVGVIVKTKFKVSFEKFLPGVVGVHQNIIIENTRCAVENKQLFRCLLCSALSQIEKRHIPFEWLRQGGELYDLAKKLHGRLQEGKVYAFPLHGENLLVKFLCLQAL